MRNFAYVVLPAVALLNMGFHARAVADAAPHTLESVHGRQIHNADYSTGGPLPQPNAPNTGSTSVAPAQPMSPPSRDATQPNRKGDAHERPQNAVKPSRDAYIQSASAHSGNELVKPKGRAFPRSPPKKSSSALPPVPDALGVLKKPSAGAPVPLPPIPSIPAPATPAVPKLPRDTDSKNSRDSQGEEDSSPRKVPNVKESHPKRATKSEADLPVPAADEQSKLPLRTRRGTDSKKPNGKQPSPLPVPVPDLPIPKRRSSELKISQDSSSGSPEKLAAGVPRSIDVKKSHGMHSLPGEELLSTDHGKPKAPRNIARENPGNRQDGRTSLHSEHLVKLPRGSGDADTKNAGATNKSQSEAKKDQPLDLAKNMLLPIIPREVAAQNQANNNAALAPLDPKDGPVQLPKTRINLKRQADEKRWEQDPEHPKVNIRTNGNDAVIGPRDHQEASHVDASAARD